LSSTMRMRRVSMLDSPSRSVDGTTGVRRAARQRTDASPCRDCTRPNARAPRRKAAFVGTRRFAPLPRPGIRPVPRPIDSFAERRARPYTAVLRAQTSLSNRP
jgi:hypothetical protein